MPSSGFYQTNYNTICDCYCDCSCDTDFGKYRWKVIAKNTLEFLLACYFLSQMIIGGIFLNDDIYPKNVTSDFFVCDIGDEKLTTLNVQKMLIVTGLFGLLMMIFKMIHFNFEIYYEDYRKTIILSLWSFYISFLIVFIFNILNTVFLFVQCRNFKSIFEYFVVTMVFNYMYLSGYLAVVYFENLYASPENIRGILLQG